jgi:hypothetical protein
LVNVEVLGRKESEGSRASPIPEQEAEFGGIKHRVASWRLRKGRSSAERQDDLAVLFIRRLSGIPQSRS